MLAIRAVRRRLVLAAGSGERGLGLSELLVAMVLFGIVLAVVSGLFVSTQRNFTLSSNITDNTKAASNGMNEAARLIRAGTENPVAGQPLPDPAFVSAANESVTLYAYINLDASVERPIMVRLALDAERRLVESRWAAVSLPDGHWGFPSPASRPDSTRTLAQTVAPHASGSPSLFTYLRSDGAPMAGSDAGLPSDQLSTIASVQVTLTVQASLTNAGNPVTLQNTVGIPNLNLNRTGA